MRTAPLLVDGALGSLLFAQTGRLSERNHVYEAFNLDNPGLIEALHRQYLLAGAGALTTNTFGANHATLATLGMSGSVAAINKAAVQVARDAIAAHAREAAGSDRAPAPAPAAELAADGRDVPRPWSCFVLGSIGPAPGVAPTAAAVRQAYIEQIEILVAAGVDALLLETFTSLELLVAVLELIGSVSGDRAASPAIIAQVAARQDSETGAWNLDPAALIAAATAAGADVVGANCCAPWEASAFVSAGAGLVSAAGAPLLLSVMPNAGGFERIGHRFMSRVNPEFMGRLARDLAASGAALIGGCCEVHPEHIREMAAFLRAASTALNADSGAAATRAPGAAAPETATSATFATSVAAVVNTIAARTEPAGDEHKRHNGRFSAKLERGAFVVSVELLPPRGTGARTLADKIELVRELADSGVADAVDITDGSRGIPLMPPGDLIALIRRRLGWAGQHGDELELIPHFTMRDLNTMAIQSRLVGYHARGIRNVLFITGDPPKMSPTYPRSTAVFDMDSIAAIDATHRLLNAGLDFGGQPLGRQRDPRTQFTIGTGFEPEALHRQRELERLQRKIDAGADYVMTQPVFTAGALEALEVFRTRVPILVGVMVLSSLAQAERLARVPGVVVPDAVLERIGAFPQPADQQRAGIELANQQIAAVAAGGWAGLYLMAPGAQRAALTALRNADLPT